MNSILIQQKEKSAQLMWTGFILAFFLIQAIIWTVAISITSRDNSHAVVAGYDEQALRWDEQQELVRASQLLGWTSTIAIESSGDIRGNRTITLKLAGRDGALIENATVELRAFHRGQAAEVQHIHFSEIEPGTYTGSVQIRRAGHWQFSGIGSVGEDQFLIEERTFLNLTKAH